MRKYLKRFISLWLLSLGICQLGIASLTLQVEPSQVMAGETVKLILTSTGQQMVPSSPDLTPLQQNFEIIGTEQTMHYNFINGRSHTTIQWIVLVIPKRVGTLAIPSLKFGQEQSNSSSIEVSAGASNFPKAKQAQIPQRAEKSTTVMLKTKVNELNPFLNQQVVLTITLYTSQHLIDANYQMPQIEDALLIPIDSKPPYQITKNNQLYMVEEQQYLLFPQRTGRLEIPSPVFQALIYDNGFPKRINVQAKPITMQVKHIPSSYTPQNWLPANQVILSDSYDNAATTLAAGTTLLRSIKLQVNGTAAQLLPPLKLDNQDNFNVYPDKPEEKNRVSNNELIGTRIVKVNYLLDKPGQVTIPELQVRWYNILTGKDEVATLGARTIDVIASPTIGKENSHAVSKNTESTTINKDQEARSLILTSLNPPKSSNLAWWLVGVMTAIWCLTLFMWFWHRKYQRLTQPCSKRINLKSILQKLKVACQNNDPFLAKGLLIQWAHFQWPQSKIFNLKQIEDLVGNNRELKQELNNLTEILYSQSNSSKHQSQLWQGLKLWQAVTSFKPESTNTAFSQDLPPIHRL